MPSRVSGKYAVVAALPTDRWVTSWNQERYAWPILRSDHEVRGQICNYRNDHVHCWSALSERFSIPKIISYQKRRITACATKTCYQVVIACVTRVLLNVLSFCKMHFMLLFGVGRLFLLDCLWLLQFRPILKTLTKSADGRFIKSNTFKYNKIQIFDPYNIIYLIFEYRWWGCFKVIKLPRKSLFTFSFTHLNMRRACRLQTNSHKKALKMKHYKI